ncbi:MAG: lactate utilization protein [Gemmatimonadota bacterium]|nr:lactate utilization protein [Gemmatimonadota bacterium]
MNARDRILAKLRETLPRRESVAHPGPFGGWRPGSDPQGSLARFQEMFEAAGGECVRVASLDEARAVVDKLAADHGTIVLGQTVPDDLAPDVPVAAAADASLGLSIARGAIGETGSIVLDSRDGRRAQLLAPTHIVLIEGDAVHESLVDLLAEIADDLPAAIGLHSGPSKSADIGQVMVRGVHGPGRLIALIVAGDGSTGEPSGRRPS